MWFSGLAVWLPVSAVNSYRVLIHAFFQLRALSVAASCLAVYRTQPRTVVRAIRITRELDDLLKDEAREKRVNLNAFMQGVLMKYFEWDKYAEKFRFVQIPHELFMELIEAGDEGRVLGICREQGRLVKEAILFWFKKITLETFLQYTSLVMKYSLGNQAEYDFKMEGKNAVMTVHHQFGGKYSRGFAELLGTAIRESLGVSPLFETTETQIMIRFTMP